MTKKAIDASTIKPRLGSNYPEPFAAMVAGREKRALGDVFGLDGFGVNLVRLPPNCPSSMRHWHGVQDELVYVLEGEVVLERDDGEQVLTPGMVVGFKGGDCDGHRLVNKSDNVAVYLEVGDRREGDSGEYPDVDLKAEKTEEGWRFIHKDGTPY
jgi:uncharacterized cupin superfamily protein